MSHRNITIKSVAISAAVLAFACVAVWFFFGSSTYTSTLGTVVTHRFFGRTTSIDMYFPGERAPVEHFVYSWSEPYQEGDSLASCAVIPPARWQDRNHDGH